MKKVLNWAKSNLVIVICVVVAVIALPTLLIVSSGMTASVQEEVAQEVQTDLRALQQLSVTYRAPTVEPGRQPIEFRRPPNEATTRVVEQYIDALKSQATEVYEMAERFNRDDFRPMIEGLFPTPEPVSGTQLRQTANSVWLDAHSDLLASAGAGEPPDEQEVLQQLQGLHEQELSTLRSQGVEITAAEEQEVREKLSGARIARYNERAAELTFYAAPDVFTTVSPWADGLPSIPLIWDWQHRLWTHRAVMQGLARANTDPVSGAMLSVPEAPIKRVLSIETQPWELSNVSTSTVQGDENTPVSLDYTASITGRAAFPLDPNPVFDIRYVRLALIVDSDRIPLVINALSRTNLITVIDMDLSAVDAGAHRRAGYMYGADHVVQADILLETIWLRSWMARFMPPTVRDALGVPAPPDSETDQPADAVN